MIFSKIGLLPLAIKFRGIIFLQESGAIAQISTIAINGIRNTLLGWQRLF